MWERATCPWLLRRFDGKSGRQISIKAYLCELEDQKKATQKYISAFGSEFSYDHCSDKEKNAMMGKMAVNDLSKSSFAGVTAQLQVYR